MSSELKVDLTALGEAASMLASIAAEFDDAGVNTATVTASIGNKNETHNLRHEVEQFANTWKIRRQEMQTDVSYLAEISAMVAETLGKADTDLATGLTGSTTQNSYTPGGGPV